MMLEGLLSINNLGAHHRKASASCGPSVFYTFIIGLGVAWRGVLKARGGLDSAFNLSQLDTSLVRIWCRSKAGFPTPRLSTT